MFKRNSKYIIILSFFGVTACNNPVIPPPETLKTAPAKTQKEVKPKAPVKKKSPVDAGFYRLKSVVLERGSGKDKTQVKVDSRDLVLQVSLTEDGKEPFELRQLYLKTRGEQPPCVWTPSHTDKCPLVTFKAQKLKPNPPKKETKKEEKKDNKADPKKTDEKTKAEKAKKDEVEKPEAPKLIFKPGITIVNDTHEGNIPFNWNLLSEKVRKFDVATPFRFEAVYERLTPVEFSAILLDQEQSWIVDLPDSFAKQLPAEAKKTLNKRGEEAQLSSEELAGFWTISDMKEGARQVMVIDEETMLLVAIERFADETELITGGSSMSYSLAEAGTVSVTSDEREMTLLVREKKAAINLDGEAVVKRIQLQGVQSWKLERYDTEKALEYVRKVTGKELAGFKSDDDLVFQKVIALLKPLIEKL